MATTSASSDRRLRWLVLACAVAAILTCGMMVHSTWRMAQVRRAVPLAAELPSRQLAHRERDLDDAILELRKIDYGIETTADAIARLSKTNPQRDAKVAAELGFVRAYLLHHDVPQAERRWLVLTLLSPQVPLQYAEDLALLERYGQLTDGPALGRKTPPRDHVQAWFDLLRKWDAAPSHQTLVNLFVEDMGRNVRLAYEAQNDWPNDAAIRAAAEAHRLHPSAPQLLGVLSDGDAWSVRVLAKWEAGETVPAAWIEAAGRTPPSPLTRDLCVQTALRRFATFRDVGQVAWHLPLLESWNEPSLWEAAEQIVVNETRELSATNRQSVGSPQRRVAIERLVWSYERQPRPEVGKLLAALGPPQDAPSLWAVAELARRRPELARQAGIVVAPMSAAVASKPSAESDGAEPRGDAPGDLAEAIEWLQSSEKQPVLNASRWLAKTPIDEARQADVLAALTAHLARIDDALQAVRAAYCSWAGPAAVNVVVSIGAASRDEAVMAAAVRALLRLQSPKLFLVARVHAATTPWPEDLFAAWAEGQDQGEEALCGAVIAIRAHRPLSNDALKFLAEHGGPRSLAVLKNLGSAPSSDQAAIESSIRKLELRLRAHSDN